jgi:hypothetical protein
VTRTYSHDCYRTYILLACEDEATRHTVPGNRPIKTILIAPFFYILSTIIHSDNLLHITAYE